MVSIIGRNLNYFEKVVCQNMRRFIGNHEKTLQILFLSIYIFLQLILIYCFPKTIVTIIVIIFLFFLSLERIFLHVWLEEERERFERKERKIKERISWVRKLYMKERKKK